MPENMDKWASEYGQFTQIGLSEGFEGGNYYNSGAIGV